MFELILKFILFVGFFMGGFLLVAKFIHHSKMEVHNEVAGFIYAVIGVIYAVLLAFVVITVWEQYTDAERNANVEVSHVIDVYRNANAFPDSVKNEIREEVANYMRCLVKYEWPAMYKSEISEEAKNSYNNIWEIHLNFKPTSSYENIWYAEAIKELNSLADARRFRIDSIYYDVPFFMWIVLFIGAFLTIAFGYMFGTKNRIAHLIMIFCLAGTICLVLILIQALEHPYTGLVHVTPESLIKAMEQLNIPLNP